VKSGARDAGVSCFSRRLVCVLQDRMTASRPWQSSGGAKERLNSQQASSSALPRCVHTLRGIHDGGQVDLTLGQEWCSHAGRCRYIVEVYKACSSVITLALQACTRNWHFETCHRLNVSTTSTSTFAGLRLCLGDRVGLGFGTGLVLGVGCDEGMGLGAADTRQWWQVLTATCCAQRGSSTKTYNYIVDATNAVSRSLVNSDTVAIAKSHDNRAMCAQRRYSRHLEPATNHPHSEPTIAVAIR
jgi:hypothetical protein